jgi:hypothetical protein
VYYSEELKYAKKLGYNILPICGYLFEKMDSPFFQRICSDFRLKAKEEGNK